MVRVDIVPPVNLHVPALPVGYSVSITLSSSPYIKTLTLILKPTLTLTVNP